jgi:hypothetical protein
MQPSSGDNHITDHEVFLKLADGIEVTTLFSLDDEAGDHYHDENEYQQND